MGDSSDIPGVEADDNLPTAAELEAAGQSALFGAPEPVTIPAPAETPAETPKPVVKAAPAQPYRVLARKYRSQTFAELIGQDAMVQTLANAIKRDRLAHAFLMTGIRGIGKTSTARLIAKALNCIGVDGKGGPTINPCGVCEPCVGIAEGRHIDVIEMDAASHTGVDDVREIIEAVRYSAVSARYKIYIIDEVHMLSRNAFNALLKTLEEPPAHVKFLFATTEVDKLPVTVLSRCQRFDLRRIPADLLASHFANICGKEGVMAEAEALAMIAEAAEGSVRDGLSILDQAIAHADMATDGTDTRVTEAQVRDMLGLADKGAQRRLFGALLTGDGAGVLELVASQFALGVEPVALMRGAMELTHRVTVAQLGRRDVAGISADERATIEGWAQQISAGQLHRLWQLLLKGHDEVRAAPDPLVAAEMALLRCLHAAGMPDPGELVRRMEAIAARAPVSGSGSGSGSGLEGGLEGGQGLPPPAPAQMDWAALVRQVEHHSIPLGAMMRMQVRVIELAPGRLVFAQVAGFSEDITAMLKAGLAEHTGQYWEVERRAEGGAPSLVEIEDGHKAEADRQMRASPLVAAAMAAFPGAEFVVEDQSAGGAPRRQGWSR